MKPFIQVPQGLCRETVPSLVKCMSVEPRSCYWLVSTFHGLSKVQVVFFNIRIAQPITATTGYAVGKAMFFFDNRRVPRFRVPDVVCRPESSRTSIDPSSFTLHAYAMYRAGLRQNLQQSSHFIATSSEMGRSFMLPALKQSAQASIFSSPYGTAPEAMETERSFETQPRNTRNPAVSDRVVKARI